MFKQYSIRLFFSSFFALFFVINVSAQDPEFTQFYANPIYLNPAFAGTNICPRVNLNWRNQWPGVSGTFITYSASFDQHSEAIHGGLGLLVTTDQAANSLQTTRVSGMYSYQLKISRKFSIRMGMEATFFQKTLDWSKLTFGDMIDPRRGFVLQTGDQPRGGSTAGLDFSAGFLGFSESFYFGFAAHHLTQPNESLIKEQSKLPMKLTAHAGAMIPLAGAASQYQTEDAMISPNIIYRRQADFQQLNMGLYVKKGPLVGGVWYRNRDAFIVLLGIQSDNLKIGYSYDVTISKLANATAGSHELSFQINFNCRPKKKTFRTISCPSF